MTENELLHLNHTVDSIVDAVCEFMRVDKDDFLSTSRDRLLVDARRIVINIITREESHSISGAARAINKNHATAIHYRKTHDHLYASNARYRYTYDMCSRKYKGDNYASFEDFLEMGKKYRQLEIIVEDRDNEIADLKYQILKLENKFREHNFIIPA